MQEVGIDEQQFLEACSSPFAKSKTLQVSSIIFPIHCHKLCQLRRCRQMSVHLYNTNGLRTEHLDIYISFSALHKSVEGKCKPLLWKYLGLCLGQGKSSLWIQHERLYLKITLCQCHSDLSLACCDDIYRGFVLCWCLMVAGNLPAIGLFFLDSGHTERYILYLGGIQ